MSALSDLSTQLAAAVERASQSLVAIHARRRIPSSGIVWRDGIIVSASHTVRRDDDITVTLPGGDTARATLVGRDASTDLAALRFDGRARPAEHAAADALRVGALVLAVGRPGRHATASFGIVSALGEGWRTWEGSRIERVARLDLAIHDGFSGGPLVDASGAVLGMNNSALARGTPMVLPAAAVNRVLDELLERGHVRRPFIGVAVQPVVLPPSTAGGRDAAVLVTGVAEGSPAAEGGLYGGDVLLAADGRPLGRPTDLLDALAATTPGAAIALELLRGGKPARVSLTPADRTTSARPHGRRGAP